MNWENHIFRAADLRELRNNFDFNGLQGWKPLCSFKDGDEFVGHMKREVPKSPAEQETKVLSPTAVAVKKWEYMTLGQAVSLSLTELNRLGDDGWELILHETLPDKPKYHGYIFKRPKREIPESPAPPVEQDAQIGIIGDSCACCDDNSQHPTDAWEDDPPVDSQPTIKEVRCFPINVRAEELAAVKKKMKSRGWTCTQTLFDNTVLVFERVPELPATETESKGSWSECHCPCHSSDNVVHCIPCCAFCLHCGLNIAGDFDAHFKEQHSDDPPAEPTDEQTYAHPFYDE